MKPKKVNSLVALVLVALATPSAALAQSNGLFDHTTCYKVSTSGSQFVVNTHAGDQLVLRPYQVPPFAIADGCNIIPRPVAFCIPVDKSPRLDPTGTALQNDYLVYNIRCKQRFVNFNQGVKDQFSQGVIKVNATPYQIQVPAYKISTPPPTGCSPTAISACGGDCPTAGDLCALRTDATGVITCGCFPSTASPCGLVPGTTAQCGGDCVTGICTSTPQGCICG
ncbi:MAG: hypothetical protein WCH13_09580 [Deltaproteobacteria bacterium]